MTLSQRPIFILGAPRSGTTLMRSIIDAHPNILCPMWETGLFVQLDAVMNGDVLYYLQSDEHGFPLSRSDLLGWARRAAEDLMQLFASRAGKKRWAEKTPAHVFNMRLIAEVFPDSQFVHMIRNGYEVVRSLQNMSWAPRSIRWSTERWSRSVLTGREVGVTLGPKRYCEVRYEMLTTEPEQTVRELCSFLDEPFEPQMLQFDRAENNSWGTVQQPLQRRPVNNYRELGTIERLVFQLKGGRLQRELGYR